eukprot:258173-Rhodomonas_salina.2
MGSNHPPPVVRRFLNLLILGMSFQASSRSASICAGSAVYCAGTAVIYGGKADTLRAGVLVCLVCLQFKLRNRLQNAERQTVLCTRYAMSGTDLGQTASSLLCTRYAMSGTERGYAATRRAGANWSVLEEMVVCYAFDTRCPVLTQRCEIKHQNNVQYKGGLVYLILRCMAQVPFYHRDFEVSMLGSVSPA